jgi:hypothetical protein
MISLILILICVVVFYIITMQIALVGKANFHPIHGKGLEWLQQELRIVKPAIMSIARL